MNTIGLIVNLEKPRAEETAHDVAARARTLGFTLVSEESIPDAHPEAILVLGGDGTILTAAHTFPGIPLVGFNIGSLGYLTGVEESQFDEALGCLRDDCYTVSRRSALAVSVAHESGKTVALSPALNDVVCTRGASGHAVEIDLIIDGMRVSRFLCDGIIVATPTGSTAYSLSAGGPIMMADTPAFVVNLICPHTLTSRPLVVQDTARIAIRPVSCDVPMLLSSDGRDDETCEVGDTVNLCKSDAVIPLIELQGYNPYDVLRRKLGWGGRAKTSHENE